MPGVSPVVRQAFGRYHWPGNVRELENACERIAQTCTCSMVRVGCLPASVLFGAANGLPIAASPPDAPHAAARVSLDARLHEVEAHLIGWALEASHGNKSRAAELLRIKRSTLGDRIRRLGLDHPAAESAPAKHETQE
jgi:DNA-binding NtrC family response regulator